MAKICDADVSLFPERVAKDFVIGPEAIAIGKSVRECRDGYGHVSIIAPPMVGLGSEGWEPPRHDESPLKRERNSRLEFSSNEPHTRPNLSRGFGRFTPGAIVW